LPFIDLGTAPPSNAYLTHEKLHTPEKWFPLRVNVCDKCWLVQTEDFNEADELFDDDYAYFSSFSTSWLAHARQYVETMVNRFDLTCRSFVCEVAANDGYLLQYVLERDIPCIGIEPTSSTALAAHAKGIPIVGEFFGTNLAKRMASEGKQADLMVANNVLAHVPDINDFVSGFAILLKPQGVATFEFPHLMRLVAETQFDTIYHEHFSYLSLSTVQRVFEANGLRVFDVEELPTHGGSLRVFAQRIGTGTHDTTSRLAKMMELELRAGMYDAKYYAGFQNKADTVKNDFKMFLLKAKKEGKIVTAYGAAAKGNTLMNYTGVKPDLIHFVVDLATSKQGKYMPGSRIPIVSEARIKETKPDYVVILPWNLSTEIKSQLDYIRKWGGRFVTAIPKLDVE
jgi:2-polyprenyl-3-methyl-5-hydroxy-6-metoxy-1,4-benzoquinol methylase